MSLTPASASTGGSFTQQGSVDWVSLSKETVGFSVQILSQLARGGVHPYTLVVGQCIGTNFRLSPVGSKNFENALKELKAFGAFNDLLRFGFSVECLPRLLSKTEQGMICSAICATLAEYYQEDVAAGILDEMAKLTQLPEELTPSLIEWRSLLRVFQGVVSATEFPLIISQLAKLMTHYPAEGVHRPALWERADAPCVARVLRALGDVSRSELTSVKIKGHQYDLAWIAAFSLWLLRLRTTVTIKTRTFDPVLIYSNCRPEDAQVQIFYNAWDTSMDQQLEAIGTFQLTSGASLMKWSGGSSITGRVEWKDCLSVTFGDPFYKLCEMKSTVGSIFGSIARILEEFPGELPHEYSRPRHQGGGSGFPYGKDLVWCLVHQFPELLPIQPFMDSAVTTTCIDAQTELKAKIALLRSACACKTCMEPPYADFLHHPCVREDCLLSIVGTILVLGRLLARTSVTDRLFPTMHGLQQFHSEQCIKRQFPRPPKYDESSVPLRPADFRPQNFHGLQPEEFRDPKGMIREVLLLFTGRNVKNSIDNTVSAHSVSGICVYFDSLCELPDPDANFTNLHVMPGQILYRLKQYNKIYSPSVTTHTIRDIVDSFWDVSLLVTPEIGGLEVQYQARSRDNVIQFSPYNLTKALESITYTRRCPQLYCAKQVISSQKIRSSSHQDLKIGGREIEVFSGDKTLACIFFVQEDRPPIIFRQDCCLDCCFRFVDERHHEAEHVYIFQDSGWNDLSNIRITNNGDR